MGGFGLAARPSYFLYLFLASRSGFARGLRGGCLKKGLELRFLISYSASFASERPCDARLPSVLRVPATAGQLCRQTPMPARRGSDRPQLLLSPGHRL